MLLLTGILIYMQVAKGVDLGHGSSATSKILSGILNRKGSGVPQSGEPVDVPRCQNPESAGACLFYVCALSGSQMATLRPGHISSSHRVDPVHT